MADQARVTSRRLTLSFAIILTALAFVGLHVAGLIGTLPLPVLLGALFGSGLASELAGRRWYDVPGRFGLVLVIQMLAVTVVIYVIGWGPTLAIGYLFPLGEALRSRGASSWRIAYGASLVGLAAGEAAIALGLVHTYVPVPYVHGLAALAALGLAFVMYLLASTTAARECAEDDARREATRARALLSLSTSWAETQTADEIGDKVARAVPEVIGCDQAAVAMFDPEARTGRIVGTWGFLPEVEVHLRAVAFERTATTIEDLSFYDAGTKDSLVRGLMAQTGSIAAASVPVVADGELMGAVVAAVREDAARLQADPELQERLRGLAGQAAISFRNARLLDQIRHQAMHDALTGLPNRSLILDRAEQMLGRARREHRPVAALFVDLDNFKDINDTLGHEAGDKLLKAVAVRFAGALRANDTVGRLGGDEFVVLAEGMSLAAGPELVAERLQDVLREPFHVEGCSDVPMSISASIGIAEGARATASDLLRDADIALYRAKATGKGRFALFQPEMQSAVLDRLELEMELRSALANGEFFLLYQPVFDLDNVSVCGVEALLRWQHSTRGVVAPDEFIPVLEETGMIIEVGRWVLQEACRQAAAWRIRGLDLIMSVNVSVRQLEVDSFLDHVREALLSNDMEPDELILEITESTLMRDTEATIRRLKLLKEIGVLVAIDDFGTGYSSLAYLRQFPVDALKIDRSFVSGMADSAESAALIHTLVQLGRTLGIETLAEGIEEAWQLEGLQREHCHLGQGFLFARPLAAAAVETFVSGWAAPIERGVSGRPGN
jgi:diguanylate cyclase (GGDEF)-like protein